MAGLYIHIPFCKTRCIYCDFFSTTAGERVAAYVDALCGEIAARCAGREFDTIYIGGGTPSWIGVERIVRIIEAIPHPTAVREFTIECNPDDVTEDFVEGLRRTSVNRVSLGVQTLTDERLRLIGRRHTARQAVEAVERLRENGYGNISVDMIYGLPGQTMEEWERDLGRALALGTPHLSAYSLMYEEGTALWKMREEHKVAEAHEELSIAMYHTLIDKCAEAGLEQYELSNFARKGFESRHNSAYWRGGEYVGVGAGAHSYDGGKVRRLNAPDLDAYIGGWEHSEETLSEDELFNEAVFTGLRTMKGVDWSALEARFPRQSETIKKIAERHVCLGNLEFEDGHLRLTRQALFVSDDVMSDLMVV